MRPTLNLNFAETKKLDRRITFTRDSVGTYFDRNGVMKTAAAGVPRFDHDPVTKESLGLLIEEARTNLLTYSEQFDNAAWSKFALLGFGSGSIANTITAPDGTLTADYFKADLTTATHYITNTTSISYTSGNTYTISVHLKLAECRYAEVFLPSVAFPDADRSAIFDLQTGIVSRTFSGVTATIKSLPNGWYRCSVTATADATIAGASAGITLNRDGTSSSQSFSGTTFPEGVYVWGAQLEAGAFPTSYIPTTSASVPRVAEVAQMIGTNFSSWYNQSEGTFVSRYYTTNMQSNACAWSVDDGIGQNHIVVAGNSTTSDRVILVSSGTSYVSTLTNNVISGYSTRALTYKKDDFATSANGEEVRTDSLMEVPAVTALTIGKAGYFLSSYMNGTIAQLTYYPKRFPNRTLQPLSLTNTNLSPKESKEFNFVKGSFDLSNITFTRDDNYATYFDKTGVMRTAAVDRPRIDYDPLTLECKGLLMEPTRTNHLGYTADMTTGWGNATTKTLNYGVAPDGTSTSILLNDDDAVNYKYVNSTSIAAVVGTYYCSSIYVKKDSVPSTTRFPMVRVIFYGGTNRASDFRFDTSTGENLVLNGSGLVGGLSGIQDCGDWWRVYVSATTTQAENTTVRFEFYPAVGSGVNFNVYSGTNTGSCEVWGPQFETGMAPTSYIPCPTTSRTRSIESMLVSGTKLTDWFDTSASAKFTILAAGTYSGATSGSGVYPNLYSLSNDSFAERIVLYYNQNGGDNSLFYQVEDNSVTQYVTGSSNMVISRGVRFSTGVTVGDGEYTSVINNNSPLGTTGKTLPSVSVLRIGAAEGGGNVWHGHIEKVMFYGDKVSTSELQGMVSSSSSTENVPTLSLNFDKMTKLPKSITFTRADATSCATYFDSKGVMKIAAANVPRFDYDPVTLEPLGLLIESGSTNLLTYSEDFTHANWGKSTLAAFGSGSVANAITAPDGTLTADKLVVSATTPSSPYFTASQVVASTQLTFTSSTFVKAGEYTYCGLRIDDNGSTNTATVSFNLNTGTISVAAQVSGTASNGSATITAYSDGWFRITLTATFASMTNVRSFLRILDNTGASGFTGNGTSGIYFWGAQLEAGAFATSYIPCPTTSVSRQPDRARMLGTNFSSWYNSKEGSLVVRGNATYNSTAVSYPRLVGIEDGTGQTECIQCAYIAVGDDAYWNVYDGSVSQAYTQGVSTSPGVYNTLACSYDRTTLHGAANGVKGSIDSTIGSLPTVDQMSIGSLSGASYLNGHVSKLVYYPKKFTEDQLEDLSSVTNP